MRAAYPLLPLECNHLLSHNSSFSLPRFPARSLSASLPAKMNRNNIFIDSEEISQQDLLDSSGSGLRSQKYDVGTTLGSKDDPSGPEQGPAQPKSNKQRYNGPQVRILEKFFQANTYPDSIQKEEISKKLGVTPLQVACWFQHKRNNMSITHFKHANWKLRSKNEKLQAQINHYMEVIDRMSFDEQWLKIENARLREEINRISSMAAKLVDQPSSSQEPSISLDLTIGIDFQG